MTPRLSVIEVMQDPSLFAPWFQRRTFDTWRIIHKAVWGLGLEMSAEEFAVFQKYTGRTELPTKPFDEVAIIAGRSAGKSLNSAFMATYLAAFCRWPSLVRGEIGVALCLATDKTQASVVFSFIDSFFTEIPLLQRMVVSRSKDSITIANGDSVIRLEVHASDFRAVRGFSLIAVVADEIAFWSADRDASSPDVEIINAVRPGLARVPGSKLILISSPFAERGVLFDLHQDSWGIDDSQTLVFFAPTVALNPTMSQEKIDAEIRKDPERMSAEYGYSWRQDSVGLFLRSVLSAATDFGVFERSPVSGTTYQAFVDPSGGVSDSLVLCVTHQEKQLAIVDMIREVESPCNPAAAIQSFSKDLRRYWVSEVEGDAYAGKWPAQEFAKHNITYRPSELDRSKLYAQFLPLVNSAECRLLDHPKMVNQFVSLRRTISASGNQVIDHPARGHAHDDVANCVSGAILLVSHDEGRTDGVSSYQRSILGLDPPIPDSGFVRRIEEHMARLERSSPAVAVASRATCCPSCSAENAQKVPGFSYRCQNCGHQWPTGEAPPVYHGGNRRGMQVFRMLN